ncbi:MAG: exodeoxyribonuclease V subunit gamma [Desulfocapsaceae bacterium]
MFVLYNSNRTEALAEQLARVISNTGGHTLFAKAIFLVQSREMERMLCQFLADRFGVWGNSRYLLPMQFIEHICQILGVNLDSAAFDRSILTWRLELLLRDLADPAMQPLKSYLSGDQSDLKRYQFARQIAHLFDQYQIMRPELIRAWDRGRRFTTNSSEGWQLYLWEKLREQSSGNHRGEVISGLIDRLQESPDYIPPELGRIFVFGLHTLPPLFLTTLKAMAGATDIHFFLLAPCAHYWGDIETIRTRVGRDPVESEKFGSGTFHPLLAGLGRQGADFQELLLDQVEEMIDGPDLFVSHDDKIDTPVLQRIQNDLLAGVWDETETSASSIESDDSVVIVSCHSRMRETSVLKDYILKWLSDDPQLRLHDIVVMAPDIQLYADLIPAVFKDVVHDISDCRKRRDNRYVEIFSQFLDLFSGRFSGPEIVSLLDQPEVRTTFSISSADLETIRYWLKDVGIRWGLSLEQRHQDGLPDFQTGTWLNGLERMLLGLAAGSKEPIDSVVPYVDIEGGDAELLGGLCSFIELIDQSRRETKDPLTLLDWSKLLPKISGLLFGDIDSADFLKLQELLTGLAEQSGGRHNQRLSFEVIQQWFEYEAEATSSMDFLKGRLTFCSMLPMRSIPFKVICLLGLNDGEFPKQDRFLPFNLLTQSYEKGDRSQRADDRYQFLEAILAARQRLYLSYIGQSIRTNEPIPPSPVVSELIESIEQSGASVTVRCHPLQPFDASYFSSETDLFSHHRYYCRTAQSFRSPPGEVLGPWFNDQLDVVVDDHLHFDDLMSFVGNPQRFFVSRILKMTLRTEEELLEDNEPFSLEALDRYLVSQEVLDALIRDTYTERLFDELLEKQVWPLGYPGRMQFEKLHSELEKFAARLKITESGEWLENIEFDVDIGQTRISGVLGSRCDNGLLVYRYGSIKGRDLLQGWLLHLVAGAAGERTGPTTILLKDATVTIDADSGTVEDLRGLVELYQRGCKQPSKLYTEAAFNYCRQVFSNRERGRTEPLVKAIKTLDRQIDNGYVEELGILFREPRGAVLLDSEFEDLCRELILPIMERVKIDTNV